MDRSAAQALYLKIVFCVLGISTYALVASVFSFRPQSEPNDILTSMVRLPAALPAAIPLPMNLPLFNGSIKTQDSFKIETLALSCWDSGQGQVVMNTTARMVRLTGRACADNLISDSWKVSNESNGFSATVFEPTPKQLTTDFVPLLNGRNEIRIAVLGPDGTSHEASVIVERQ